MNGIRTSHNKYPVEFYRTPGSNGFNPMLLLEQERSESFPYGLTGYYYKNYDIRFSIRTHNNYPHRVLSITPHGFSPLPMEGPELSGLLEHFGFYSFLSVGNYSSATNDPYTGDTQYYYQMIMDMQDLQDLPVAAGQ